MNIDESQEHANAPAGKRAAAERYNFCLSCCPPSERWWFRWVLPAQPLIALLLYLYYYVEWS